MVMFVTDRGTIASVHVYGGEFAQNVNTESNNTQVAVKRAIGSSDSSWSKSVRKYLLPSNTLGPAVLFICVFACISP